jgi:pimeloyl-ACP methyl ester carboxylesterase
VALFGFVHGVNHGAWCWDYLTPHLSTLGHECVTVDLPCEDPAAGIAVYADCVASALTTTDEVILVGHSLGGLTIPVVATSRPVRRLVYLCGAVPHPGCSWMDQVGDFVQEPPFMPVFHDDGSTSIPAEAAIEVFYPDCAPELQRWAVARLRRQAFAPMVEITPLERLPDVASSVIIAREDRILPVDYARQIAEERLGVTPIELDGGHSPFLARPQQLASELNKLASL